MLKIRLQRIGRKHDPAFRVVCTESTRGPKSGDYIEKLGFYHAKIGKKNINTERVKFWMDQGAQVSDTVFNFLVDTKAIEGPKKNVLPIKKPKVEDKEEKKPESPASTKVTEQKSDDAESTAEANEEVVESKTEDTQVEEKKEEKIEEKAEPEEKNIK